MGIEMGEMGIEMGEMGREREREREGAYVKGLVERNNKKN